MKLKINVATTCFLLFCLLSGKFISCKKIETTAKKKYNASAMSDNPWELEDDQLEIDIISFYGRMQELIEDSTAEDIAPALAEAWTETTFNYYAVTNGWDSPTEKHTFNKPVALNGSGNIDMDDLSDVFWEIRDELLSHYNGMTSSTKELCFFDLEVVVAGAGVSFNVTAYFLTDYYNNWNCSMSFANDYGSDYAFSALLPLGQSPDINDVSSPTPDPGAASLLRNYALYNLSACSPASCGTWSGVTTYTYNSANLVTSSSCQYHDDGIPGYENNLDKWETIVFTDNSTSCNSIDADDNKKKFLTSQMMDYYLEFVPDYFNTALNNLSGSPSLYDFHIVPTFCLCCSPNSGYGGAYTQSLRHDYEVTVGYRSNICGFVGISSM